MTDMSDYTSFTYDLIHTEPCHITAKCVVHFRPDANWRGLNYGFDWMRVGDTSAPGDNPYKDIVSKQYDNRNDLEMNINAYSGIFKKHAGLYRKLEGEYQGGAWVPIQIASRTGGAGSLIYYCPWLSLYPAISNLGPVQSKNHIAQLRLYLEVEEAPDRLEFSENKHFEISPNVISTDLKKGKYFWNSGNIVSIECKKQFFSDQKIDIFAIKKNPLTGEEERKLAGRLMAWSNQFRQKRVKVLFVKAITPNVKNVKNPNTGNYSGQSQMLESLLRQALLVPQIAVETLDLSGDSNFKSGGRYRHSSGKILAYYSNSPKPTGFINLENYMYSKLQANLSSDKKNLYKKYRVVFFIGESGGSIKSSNMTSLNGYATGDQKTVVMFSGYRSETVTHEILHSLGLPHSFSNPEATSNRAFCTYMYTKTENLMDYSHHKSLPRFALWHWQWMIVNANV